MKRAALGLALAAVLPLGAAFAGEPATVTIDPDKVLSFALPPLSAAVVTIGMR
jgi:hypothetical protein